VLLRRRWRRNGRRSSAATPRPRSCGPWPTGCRQMASTS
jgi:hypothetical protein